MALIKCAECGKEFSDRASACPNCGCPTEAVLEAIQKEESLDSAPVNFEFESSNGFKVCISNKNVSIYKKSVLKKNGKLKQLSWSDFSDPTVFLPGSINLKIGAQTFGYKLHFTKEDSEKIEELKSLSKRNAYDIMKDVSAPKKSSKVVCPKCKSPNIEIVSDKRKTTVNLNPLKPFTIVNHKTTQENWLCRDCGYRWTKKTK